MLAYFLPPAVKDQKLLPEAEVIEVMPCNGRVSGRLLFPAHFQLRK